MTTFFVLYSTYKSKVMMLLRFAFEGINGLWGGAMTQ